jgi:uncharacterized protein CbrC (UPF0167 family)
VHCRLRSRSSLIDYQQIPPTDAYDSDALRGRPKHLTTQNSSVYIHAFSLFRHCSWCSAAASQHSMALASHFQFRQEYMDRMIDANGLTRSPSQPADIQQTYIHACRDCGAHVLQAIRSEISSSPRIRVHLDR